MPIHQTYYTAYYKFTTGLLQAYYGLTTRLTTRLTKVCVVSKHTGLSLKYKHTKISVILEATADYFGWFFHTDVDENVILLRGGSL